MRTSNSSKIGVAQSTIRKLISLVRMLAVSGLISIQNADITVEAIDELGNFLHLAQRTPLSESTVLSREDLLSGGITSEKRTSVLLKDTTHLSVIKTDKTKSAITDNVRGTTRDSRTDDTMNVRGQEILGILRSGGEMGIRDISSNLPEYSEKMIQRELASMVTARRVKKTGLKRWSRYSIMVGNA